ncbi:MAG: CoA transferase [Acidimicrobiaceae bacterium]|nr:CoA transferase [Acidimicrobiaceae bacterium]
MGALSGVRVIEVGRYVSGPMASVMLADLGAQVIKVENPDGGDPFRGWDHSGGYSPHFRSLNRNKLSLALDVSGDRGKEYLLRLLDRADVLIENFRVGQADRWGWGYESVCARNPRIVYCSISGFGSTGPYQNRPGYDTVGQGMSGLLSVLTDLNAPEPVGISLADHLAGVYAAYGVLAALISSIQTGRGQKVETSLLQAAVSFQSENIATFFATGEIPTYDRRAKSAGVWTLVAKDGKPFVVHLSSPPKFWQGFATVAGHPEWIDDPRYKDQASRRTNYDQLLPAVKAAFAMKNRDEWLSELEAVDVPCAPLNDLNEVFNDEQVRALGMRRELNHPVMGKVELSGPGIALSGTPISWELPPPLLGEHTDEVLGMIGCSLQEIEGLVDSGIACRERRSKK